MGNAVACDMSGCENWAKAEASAGWIALSALLPGGTPGITLYFCSLDHAGQWSIENSLDIPLT